MRSSGIVLQHCVEILNTFPKDCKSLTVHVEDYFKNQEISEKEKLFIVDVFAETIKYHKILAIVINRFYETDGKNILHCDKNLYFVLLFLIVFRLDEIGLENLKHYFDTQKMKNMYRFLNFATDENNLFVWIELEWRKLYDPIFVENELMNNITKWLPQLREYVQQMKNILDNKPKKHVKTIPITKPVPFDLHKPKPKRVPMPELIPEVGKVKEVPVTTYIVSESKNKPAKKDPKDLLKEAEKLQPSCAQREISKKTTEKLNQIVIERDKELKFNDYKSKPAPKSTNYSSGTLKLNTATILRDWKLYENRIQKKNRELKNLEEGGFSSQKFEIWQQSLRAADLADKISQLEKLRLGGKISYEEAILKKERLVQENKQVVKSLKKENAKRLEAFAIEKALNEEKIKALVEQVIASQENAKGAKLSVEKQKRAMAKEIAEESRRLQEEMLIEAEAEMRRKIDLIAEIRALEGSQSNNQKSLDPTEIAGYGLLCEMSLAELKERLVLTKEKHDEQINRKRETILDSKQQKEKQLNDTLEFVKLCRSKIQDSKETLGINLRNHPTLECLNEDQINELKELRDELEEKRILRQNKRSKRISNVSRNTNTMLSKKYFGNDDDAIDKCLLKSNSQTAERMAQILSI